MAETRKLSEDWQRVLSEPIDQHKWREVPDTCSAAGRPKHVDLPDNWGPSIQPTDGAHLKDLKPRAKALIYPPGHNYESFLPVIHQLREIVGEDYCLLNDHPELVDGSYYQPALSHDAFALMERGDFVPSLVVQPDSTEHVRAIVKVANDLNVPLWVISVGRNLGYGGAAPRVRGSVLVDMGKRMNRVLAVDRESGTCLLEPGVTYTQLYNHMQDIGLGNELFIDTPDVGGGSVIGNMLDRGVGYSPYGDHFGKSCGMEVVLPSGELIRTGMGSMPNSTIWNSHKYGIGPCTDGIFTQSNFGITTKCGFHLMPNPGGCRTFMATFPRADDLKQIVDITRPLMLKGIIHGTPSMREAAADAAIYSVMSDFVDGFQPLTEEIREHIASKLGGRWVLYGCFYGEEDYTMKLYKKVQEAYSAIPGTRLWLREELPDWHYIHDRAKVFAGITHFRELSQLAAYPTGAGCFYAPIIKNAGDEMLKQNDICNAIFAKHGFPGGCTIYFNQRTAHYIVGINFDRNVPESKKAALRCLRDMIHTSAAEGFGEYRAHIAIQDQVMETYSFENNSQLRYFETLKDALDPNGILMPGRYGIWPKSYRGKGWELKGDEVCSDPALRLT